MSTKKKLESVVSKIGGTWDKGYDTIAAPKGYVWSSNGGHEFVMARDYDDMKFGRDDYIEAIEMIEAGLEKCLLSDCEYCA